MIGNRYDLPRSNNLRRILVALVFLISTSITIASSTAGEPIFHQTCNSDAQCLHGGACRYTETGQGTFLQCQCANGYTGSRCEHYCPLQCQHGGICRSSDKDNKTQKKTSNNDNNKKDFACRCMGYFTGRLCETPYENCNEGVRCYNYGKCQETENDHHLITRGCECPPEWTGPSCETRVYNTTSSEKDPIIESGSGRSVLWVALALLGFVGVCWAISQRKKWRSRRWRYNAVTRRAVAKFHDQLETNNNNDRDFGDDGIDDGYLNDASDRHHRLNLHDYPFKTSKFCDAPEYRNVI